MSATRYAQQWNQLSVQDQNFQGLVKTLCQYDDKKTAIYNRGPLSKDIVTFPVFFAREQLMETITDMNRQRAGACLAPGEGSWSCFIVSAFCLCLPLCIGSCYDSACIPTQAEVDVVEKLLQSVWDSIRFEQRVEGRSDAINQEVKNILTAFENTLQLKLSNSTRNKLLTIRASVASSHGIQLQNVVPFHKAQQMYGQQKNPTQGPDEKTPLTNQSQYSTMRLCD